MKDVYGPTNQFILFLISLFLLVIFITKPFKNNDYNNLALAFCVFNASWLLTLVFRYLYYQYGGSYKSDNSIIPIPMGIKCYFGEPNCEKGDFSVFSIFHFVGYFVIGLLIPGYYVEILIISYACEFLEVGIGFTSKFFLDPIVNLSGYFFGSLLSWND